VEKGARRAGIFLAKDAKNAKEDRGDINFFFLAIFARELCFQPPFTLAYHLSVNRRTLIVAVSGLFFLSGASGLIFETAWTRLFLGLFGHGIHTTSAVLAAFMGGLGLGALVAGRKAGRLRRPLRVYALLELAVAAWVVTSPLQVRVADLIVGALAARSESLLVSDFVAWVVAFGLLLVPAALMGATLPVLCRALITDDKAIGKVFGLLYGINTLGAVIGVMGAGYWSILHLGVRGSLWLGCGLNLAAAAGAMLLDRRQVSLRPRPEFPSEQSRIGDDRTLRVIQVIVGVAGACAMAYEVVWIRLFVFILGSSILSLAQVLGTLLLALGLGALILPRLVGSRSRHLAALGWSQALVALAAVGGVVALGRLDEVVAGIASAGGFGDPLSSIWGRALVVGVIVFLPGLAMGATLPAATGAILDLRDAERGIGALYAANTMGNIVGALMAGYVLVPSLGAARSLGVVAACNLVLASVVALRFGGRSGFRRWMPAAAALVGAGVVLSSIGADSFRVVFSDQKTYGRLVEVSESLRGTVTVQDVPPLPILAANSDKQGLFSVGAGYRLLAVDGVDVAGSSPDLRTTQLMQAHVPLLLHGSPRRVLQIGHGSGATAVEVGLYSPELFDLAEINPRVITEAHRWFPRWRGAHFNPVFTDAKNFVRRTSQDYDVILNDSTYPGHRGSSQLYSEDHFRACRQHLAPGGIVSTWLPVDLPPESFAMVLASFRSVFPESSFWLPLNCWNKHGVLVGSLEPIDEAVLRVRGGSWPAGVAESLAEIGMDDPEVFASSLVLDAAAVEDMARGSRRNTDDRPFLEYPARGFSVSGEQFWSETLKKISSVMPPVAGKSRAIGSLIEGQLFLLEGHSDAALAAYGRASELWPGHPGSIKLQEDVRLFRAQEDLRKAAEGTGDPLPQLEAAVARCPFSALARFELGHALFERRQFGEAVPHLEAALELGEGLDRAWLFLGDIWAMAGQPAEAERCYRTYLEENPPALEILIALGDVVAEQGREADARALYRRAAALSPGSEIVEERLTGMGERNQREEK